MPTNDITCPKCGSRCHLMAGVNVKPKWIEFCVLVCWQCAMAKIVRPNSQWESLKAQNNRPQWKKHTRHHWQTIIKGEVLDYWPSKRKWRFRDTTHVGDVEQFIKGIRDAEYRPRVVLDRGGHAERRQKTWLNFATSWASRPASKTNLTMPMPLLRGAEAGGTSTTNWSNAVSESNATNDTGSSGNAHLPPNMSDAEAWAVYGLRVAMNLAYETATKAGWYNDPATGRPIRRNFGEVIALMTSELSEALEADRKSLMDDKLPHRSGVEVELADYFIRVSDTAMARNDDLPTALIEINRLLKVYSLTELRFALGLFQSLVLAAELGYDLAGAIVEKNRFNQTRKDHKLENRAAGGKKY